MQLRKLHKALGSAQAQIQIVNNKVQFMVPHGSVFGDLYLPESASWWVTGQPSTFQMADVDPLANANNLDAESGVAAIRILQKYPNTEYLPEGSGLKPNVWYDWEDVFFPQDPNMNPVTPPLVGDDVFIQVHLYEPGLRDVKDSGHIGHIG